MPAPVTTAQVDGALPAGTSPIDPNHSRVDLSAPRLMVSSLKAPASRFGFQ